MSGIDNILPINEMYQSQKSHIFSNGNKMQSLCKETIICNMLMYQKGYYCSLETYYDLIKTISQKDLSKVHSPNKTAM